MAKKNKIHAFTPPKRGIVDDKRIFTAILPKMGEEHLEETMAGIVTMSQVAGSFGLLQLERYTPKILDIYLSTDIENVIDGLDAKLVQTIAEAQQTSAIHKRQIFFALLREGCLALQCGTHPLILLQKLNTITGNVKSAKSGTVRKYFGRLTAKNRGGLGDEKLLKRRFDKLEINDDSPHNVIETMTLFSYLSRKFGLLYLEKFIPRLGDPHMRKFMELIVDGAAPEIVADIIDHTQTASLRRLTTYFNLITAGVLGIQSGNNPAIQFEILSAIIGKTTSDASRKYVDYKPPSAKREVLTDGEINELLASISTDKGVDDETKSLLEESQHFGRFILALDSRAIQRVVGQLDMWAISEALCGTNNRIKNIFFKNMSPRSALILKDDLESHSGYSKENVLRARGKIVKIIKSLEEEGEIKLPDDLSAERSKK